MKKIIAVLLAALICFSLAACGGGGKTLTVSEVEAALESSDGTLNMETSGDKVTGFTYLVENANATLILDKSSYRNVIVAILNGNASSLTYNQFKAAKVFTPMLNINSIFYDSEEGGFDANAYLDELLGVLCDGKELKYGNWTITATVDTAADTVTIIVNS